MSMGSETDAGQESRLALCAVGEVPAGGAVKIETEGLILAVFNIDGEIYVTDDTCTHGPGSLSEGCITGETVECDFHYGAFNIKTGAVTAPPCMAPLKTYVVTVTDGTVYINL